MRRLLAAALLTLVCVPLTTTGLALALSLPTPQPAPASLLPGSSPTPATPSTPPPPVPSTPTPPPPPTPNLTPIPTSAPAPAPASQAPSGPSATQPRASAPPLVWNGISLNLPSVVKAGQDFTADATLLAGGVPVIGVGLRFVLDGSQNHMVATDNTGTAHYKQRGIIPAGVHRVDVNYGFAGGSGTITVTPITFTVQTVPAAAGVTVTLDDSTSGTSDARGAMTISVDTPGIHRLKTALPPDEARVRYTFARWSDDAVEPSRQIRIEQDMVVALGLRIAYLTSIRFADLDGRPLDSARVSNVALSGPNAEIIKLSHPYPPVWLQTAMPAKYTGENGLHLTPAPYSVGTANYDSLNVASRGKERYQPEVPGTWTVKLLLFRLKLHAQDAILGSSLSKPVTLTYPSGRNQTVHLNSGGDATVLLGRGNYLAFVHSSGVSPPAPIALSKSQTAIIPVITPIDLAVIGLACLLVLAAVSALGRGEPLVLQSMERFRRLISQRHARTAYDVTEAESARETVSPPRNGRLREHV